MRFSVVALLSDLDALTWKQRVCFLSASVGFRHHGSVPALQEGEVGGGFLSVFRDAKAPASQGPSFASESLERIKNVIVLRSFLLV